MFEKSIVKEPVLARRDKLGPQPVNAPRVEFPALDKMQVEHRGCEKPNHEELSFAAPNTREIFRHPHDLHKTKVFPQRRQVTIPRHNVTGTAKNLKSYRLGSQQRTQEHCRLYKRYYFRNPNQMKPDGER